MKKILGKLLLFRIKRSFLDVNTVMHRYLLAITNTKEVDKYSWTMETGYTGILSMEYKKEDITQVVQLGIYNVVRATRHYKLAEQGSIMKHKYFFVLSEKEYQEIREARERAQKVYQVDCMVGTVHNKVGTTLMFYKLKPVVYHDAITKETYYIISSRY